VAYCATRDISLEGAQLNCGGMDFESRAPLEVDFHLEGPSGRHQVRMSGVVMHCANGRIGILFTTREPEALHKLEDLIQDALSVEGEGEDQEADRAAEACYTIFL
jgi:hypothetical protein